MFDVSLAVAAGEVVGIIGPNGSGKSTLLGVLATLAPPTAGRVSWFGSADLRSPAVRGRLGVVLDRPLHFERLTGGQNAQFFAAQYGVARPVARERLGRLFEWAGLAGARDLPVAEYSLGMRQRLGLVEALCHQPDLLLLDEPSLALDEGGQVDLARELRGAAERGAGVLMATNNVPLARDLCDRVLQLEQGRLLPPPGRPAPHPGVPRSPKGDGGEPPPRGREGERNVAGSNALRASE